MADVFISYSRTDGEFVRGLVARLTDAGREVWVDYESIPPAAKWEEDIGGSIDEAGGFVFVTSPSSLASEECAKELRRAEDGGKRVVAVAIDGAEPREAPPALGALNWVWWRESDDAGDAFAKLSSALDTDLEWVEAHGWLLVRARRWDAASDGSLLLRGKDLADAEQGVAANAGKDPRTTELQQRYLQESRRAARRRQRTLLSGVTVALAVSVVLGVLALLQRNTARSETRRATSAALAAAANDRVDARPDQALLLALAAYDSSPSADARNAGVTALEKARELGVAEFVHGDSEVRDVAFAPDGRTLAVGAADGSVRLWDLSARKESASLEQQGATAVVSVGFTRDGSRLAASSEAGAVRLWDVRTGDLAAPVLRTGRAIRASVVSPDGRSVAVVDGIGRVWLWAVGGAAPRQLEPRRGWQADSPLAFSRDGRMLAAATVNADPDSGGEGSVRVWKAASGAPVGDLPSMVVPDAMAFAPDGGTLATGGLPESDHERGELALWSVPGLTERGTLESPRRFGAVGFDPDGRTLAARLADGSLRRAARVDGRWGWTGPARRVFPASLAGGAAFSPDGRTIAVVPQGAATVRVYDLDDRAAFGRVVARRRSNGSGGALAFSPDGRKVAATDGFQVLVAPAEPTATFEPYWLKGGIVSVWMRVAFGAGGRTLAGRDDEGAVWVWNLDTRRGRPSGPGGFDLDPAGRALAAAGRRTGVSNVSSAAAVSADGHTLAIGDYDGNVWLWDSLSKGPAKRLALDPMGQQDGSVDALALSPDGTTLAVSGHDSVLLWDVRSGKPLGRPLPGAAALAFSPDGRALATDGHGLVRLWTGLFWSDLAGLRAQVCRLVAGDLTRDEWSAIAPGLSYRTSCG